MTSRLSFLCSSADFVPVHACRFNKSEEDFADKAEYDDYLEEREDISKLL